MAEYIQYSINIAMETVMVVILCFLLFASYRQKKRFFTTWPLMILTTITILALINQIVTWFLLIFDILNTFGIGMMRIVYTLDYIFTYVGGISFYIYVEALAKEGYKFKDVEYDGNKKVIKSLITWGIITSIVYVIGINVPIIYRVDNGVPYYNVIAYILMHIAAKVPYVCALLAIIKNKNVIKKHEATIISCFIFLPMISIIFDETFGLCVSYMMISFLVLVLYVRIDLERGMIIEQQERNLTERQTEIMLSQMQPHFLYNVLTTISALCEKQNALEARDVTNRFADYFRVNLDSLGKDKTIPFTKELEHIETYLWLEKVRFEDYLNINYEIGPKDFNVPSLSLQPIVENAVKHGILQKETPGTLTIKTLENKDNYQIIIEDDGVGFDINEKHDDGKSHVGIENASKRLEVICDGLLEVHSEKGKGTTVTISIPKGAKI